VNEPRIEIAPSILASDFLHLSNAVKQAEDAAVNRLHIDVMDGRFVPNITVGPAIVSCIRGATSMVLETHLMIVEPEKYVSAFAAAGADLITVHAEVSPHLYRTLQQIHDHGKLAGVAINPATNWTAVEEVLDLADLILVMTVSPGFGGQEFIEAMVPKIRKVREEIDRRGLTTLLEVDGGIDSKAASIATSAGARILVAGTAVYRAGIHVPEAVHRLQSAAQNGLAAQG